MTLRAMDSQTYEHYALMFLKAKARSSSFQEFLALWNSHNLVLNDQSVAQSLKRIIKEELYTSELTCKQANLSSSTFFFILWSIKVW